MSSSGPSSDQTLFDVDGLKDLCEEKFKKFMETADTVEDFLYENPIVTAVLVAGVVTYGYNKLHSSSNAKNTQTDTPNDVSLNTNDPSNNDATSSDAKDENTSSRRCIIL